MRRLFIILGVFALTDCVVYTNPRGQGTGTTVTQSTANATVSLQVQNGTSREIYYLYISPTTDPNWGPDVLGARTLSPGETDTYQLAPGQWDIKAEDAGHNQLFVMRGATVAENSVLTLHE